MHPRAASADIGQAPVKTSDGRRELGFLLSIRGKTHCLAASRLAKDKALEKASKSLADGGVAIVADCSPVATSLAPGPETPPGGS